MAGLRNRQRPQISRGLVCNYLFCECRLLMRLMGSSSDADEKGQREHDQRDMPVPPDETAHLVVIESELFAIGKILFNTPASSQRCDLGMQRGGRRSKDQVIGQLRGGVERATDQHRVPAIIDPPVRASAHTPSQKAEGLC